MLAEVTAGWLTGSLALLADGWHMASHAGALGISALGYWYARTRARDPGYSFGTGKVHALAGYTSAGLLGLVALAMIGEAARRVMQPTPIDFKPALIVAAVGLVVNLASAKILHHDHHDHNVRAAYAHVLSDALTSVLALVALGLGMLYGIRLLDPIVGAVGGVVILVWAVGLCRSAARQLLDAAVSPGMEQDIRRALEAVDDVHVTDLHVWEIGPEQVACVVSVATAKARDVSYYRGVVLGVAQVQHLTVEIEHCSGHFRTSPEKPEHEHEHGHGHGHGHGHSHSH
jgi:cation diffusion facilitator family transporter